MNRKNPAHILDCIGNTPLIKLRKVIPSDCADVYVKLEYLNPTGSYKDRMALAIIEEAEKRGDLKKGMTVVECTAGGTGTSLALVCSAKGYAFKVISSDAFAKEKLSLISMFGASLELVESEGGKITPELIPKMIGMVEELSKQPGNYWTKQFHNQDALSGYQNMGSEIYDSLGANIDVFIASVGTAGMLTGVTQYLQQRIPNVKVIALEPASAPLLSTGQKGSHKVDGIAVGFRPPLLDLVWLDEIRTVREEDARTMAKRLVKEEGILAGTSTGLNVVGAIEIAKTLKSGQTVVTVACDSGMKYISSGLFD
jgi:cysteine synthase